MLTNHHSAKKLCSSLQFLLLLFCITSAAVVVNTTKIEEGIVRYHYQTEEAKSLCSSIVVIGVGTTMSVADYDILATEIAGAQTGLVAAIVDHDPGNPLKLSTRRYANLVNAIAARTDEIIPVCQDSASSHGTDIFIGGHSASGMVAIQSLTLLDGFTPAGLIGLSPFKITDNMVPISVPMLLWGFSATTCGVNVGNAADQAYNLSSMEHGRVLYQLQNPSGEPSHCVFANDGCMPICPCSSEEYAWIRPAVGDSVMHFLRAVQSENFSRESLRLNLPQKNLRSYLRMFVNQDQAPKQISSILG